MFICMNLCVCVCVCVHNLCVYINIEICVCVYIYMCVCVCVGVWRQTDRQRDIHQWSGRPGFSPRLRHTKNF